MKKKSMLTIAAICCLLLVGIIGGSYAYWNQTSTVDNPFDTGKYGSTVTEDFKPSDGDDWQPGVEVNKDVFAKNTGDQDLIVRVKLDETWTRKDDPATPANEAVVYKDSLNDPYNVYTVTQANATDGLTAADASVVTKKFSLSTNWINGSDGWYYYKVNLEGGQTTDKWLDAVELLNDADMGKMQTKHYVTASTGAAENTWVWFEYTGAMPGYISSTGAPLNEGDPGAQQVLHNKVETKYESAAVKGYSDSDYTLKVTVQTVQATQEAIDALFGGGTAFTAPAGTTWAVA